MNAVNWKQALGCWDDIMLKNESKIEMILNSTICIIDISDAFDTVVTVYKTVHLEDENWSISYID